MKVKQLLIFGILACVILCASCKPSTFLSLNIKIKDSLKVSCPYLPNGALDDYYKVQLGKRDSMHCLFNVSLRGSRIYSNNLSSNEVLFPLKHKGLADFFRRHDGNVMWQYINDDSILVFTASTLPYECLLLDTSGREIRKWQLGHTRYGDQYLFITDHNGFRFDKEKNELIINIHNQFYSKEDSARFNKQKRLVSFSLGEDSLEINYFFGHVPDEHKELFLGHFGQVSSTLMNRQVVCSYEQANEIQVYENGKLVGSHYARAHNFSPRTHAFDYRRSSDRGYISGLMYAADSYYNILSSDEYVYRICLRKKEKEVDTDGLIANTPVQWSLIVLDCSFNYLGEVDMSGRGLDFNKVFPIKGKEFLIGTHDPNVYYLYELDI